MNNGAYVLAANAGTGAAAAVIVNSGGKYGLVWEATLGGGNLQLQIQGPNGTWLNCGSAISALGLTVFDLPAGSYRANITTSTANYARLVGISA